MGRKRAEETITRLVRSKFFAALARTGVVLPSAQEAGISVRLVYKLRERDADFAIEWAEAEREAQDVIVEEVRRRAFGWEEQATSFKGPIFTEDGQPVMVKKYSEKLLERLLIASNPAKYGRPDANVVQPRPADLLPDPAPTPDEPGPEKPIT